MLGFPIPIIFDINHGMKKVRFFLGDRWIIVGEITHTLHLPNKTIETNIPDLGQFLEKRKDLDDGSYDWAAWGPRVN